MNFACIQKHSFEIYESALVWIPKKSLIVYATDVRRVPRVVQGLSNLWSSTELHMQNGSCVDSVAFSQNGDRVVSGSRDNAVRIWSATTGELEAELKGHMDYVRSVAFAKDGNRVASGSDDGTVRIWNMTTGEAEARLSHSDSVKSVAFSWGGNQVVFGSRDQSVWIRNVMTKEVEGPMS